MGRGPTVKYHKELNEDYERGTLTCLKASTIKERISPEFPLVLNIEPTNDCDLYCYYCPRLKSKKPIGYIDFNLAKKIIDEAASYPRLTMLNFHKDGEFLLHPQIDAMIKYAESRSSWKKKQVFIGFQLANSVETDIFDDEDPLYRYFESIKPTEIPNK